MSGESIEYRCSSFENGIEVSFRTSGRGCFLLRDTLRLAGALPLRILATCREHFTTKLYRLMAFPVF